MGGGKHQGGIHNSRTKDRDGRQSMRGEQPPSRGKGKTVQARIGRNTIFGGKKKIKVNPKPQNTSSRKTMPATGARRNKLRGETGDPQLYDHRAPKDANRIKGTTLGRSRRRVGEKRPGTWRVQARRKRRPDAVVTERT